jgi:hypothetical protein
MTSEIDQMIEALREGEMTLDEVAQRFRERSWPRRHTPPNESYLDLAAAAQEDPDVYIPGSFDDIATAHQEGRISDNEYTVLSRAVAESKRAEDLKHD